MKIELTNTQVIILAGALKTNIIVLNDLLEGATSEAVINGLNNLLTENEDLFSRLKVINEG